MRNKDLLHNYVAHVSNKPKSSLFNSHKTVLLIDHLSFKAFVYYRIIARFGIEIFNTFKLILLLLCCLQVPNSKRYHKPPYFYQWDKIFQSQIYPGSEPNIEQNIIFFDKLHRTEYYIPIQAHVLLTKCRNQISKIVKPCESIKHHYSNAPVITPPSLGLVVSFGCYIIIKCSSCKLHQPVKNSSKRQNKEETRKTIKSTFLLWRIKVILEQQVDLTNLAQRKLYLLNGSTLMFVHQFVQHDRDFS